MHNKQKSGASQKILQVASSEVHPPARLHFLWLLQPLQTVPPTGNQVFKHKCSNTFLIQTATCVFYLSNEESNQAQCCWNWCRKTRFPRKEDIKNVLEGSYRTHLVHVLSGSQSHWSCSAVVEDLVGVSVSAFTT